MDKERENARCEDDGSYSTDHAVSGQTPAQASPKVHTLELPYAPLAPPVNTNSERFEILADSTREDRDASRQGLAMVANPNRASSDENTHPKVVVGRLVDQARENAPSSESSIYVSNENDGMRRSTRDRRHRAVMTSCKDIVHATTSCHDIVPRRRANGMTACLDIVPRHRAMISCHDIVP